MIKYLRGFDKRGRSGRRQHLRSCYEHRECVFHCTQRSFSATCDNRFFLQPSWQWGSIYYLPQNLYFPMVSSILTGMRKATGGRLKCKVGALGGGCPERPSPFIKRRYSFGLFVVLGPDEAFPTGRSTDPYCAGDGLGRDRVVTSRSVLNSISC